MQFAGMSAAYDLPGGAISMVFTGSNAQNVPDGQGGTYVVGTFELDIPEATGIYQSFVGGHNTMVDILHQLADGSFVEHCICIISRPAQCEVGIVKVPPTGSPHGLVRGRGSLSGCVISDFRLGN